MLYETVWREDRVRVGAPDFLPDPEAVVDGIEVGSVLAAEGLEAASGLPLWSGIWIGCRVRMRPRRWQAWAGTGRPVIRKSCGANFGLSKDAVRCSPVCWSRPG